jgi:hypothetical protein
MAMMDVQEQTSKNSVSLDGYIGIFSPNIDIISSFILNIVGRASLYVIT